MARNGPRGCAGVTGVMLALVLVLAGGNAYADTDGEADGTTPTATIVNASDRSWLLKITSGGQRSEHSLAAGGVLKGVCSGGCIVTLDGAEDGSYVLEGNERVAIEDGVMYYDDAARKGEQLLSRE